MLNDTIFELFYANTFDFLIKFEEEKIINSSIY